MCSAFTPIHFEGIRYAYARLLLSASRLPWQKFWPRTVADNCANQMSRGDE